MSDPRNFTITKHAIDRLRERFPDFAKENDKIISNSLKKKAIYDFLINQTSEEKSFLNNSTFMIMLGEKYGFGKQYTMFTKDNILFIGISDDVGNYIVTTMKRDEHYVNQINTKIKKYEKKSSEKLCNYYPPVGGLK